MLMICTNRDFMLDKNGKVEKGIKAHLSRKWRRYALMFTLPLFLVPKGSLLVITYLFCIILGIATRNMD